MYQPLIVFLATAPLWCVSAAKISLAIVLPALFLAGCDGGWDLVGLRAKGPNGSATVTSGTVSGSTNTSSNSSAAATASRTKFTPTETPELTERRASSVDCAGLVQTSPRGIACLHCTQPEAAEQADILVGILESTCLKNLTMNYLVDGTFGDDLSPIYEHIARLSDGGRTFFLELYLLNGPAQRRDEARFGGDVENFRRRILNDASFRGEYQRRVANVIPLLRFARSEGASISLVPMLEDNLTDEAYEALMDLTLQAIPVEIPFAIGRSPCSSCYSGNEDGIPAGVFEEIHSLGPSGGNRVGVATNDGEKYDNLAELRSLRNFARDRDAAFILWDGARQGLVSGPGSGWVRKPAAERDYPIPGEDEQQEIIDFLLEGL